MHQVRGLYLIAFKLIRMNWIKYIFPLFACLLLLSACKEEAPPNPFEQVENPNGEDPNEIVLDPSTIEGLHSNVFGKTCANSGCHDGTFEPDFRSIESTYNTLVYQPIIKNDQAGTFDYRVIPGDVAASQLIARITYDIDGTSGIMPLVVEPDSDWELNKEAYIQNVKDWVQAGAKDIMGNQPILNDNALPGMLGVAAFAGTWLGREDGGFGSLRVSKNETSIDLYIALQDDKLQPDQLSNNKIRFASNADEFTDAPELNLQVLSNPIEQPGFEGELVQYYHKITLDPMDYAEVEETAFFRVYVKDDSNPLTEIPSNGGAFYIKNYFSFKVIE